MAHSALLTVDDLKDRLIPFSEVIDRVSVTEPVSEFGFPLGTGVKFTVQDDWTSQADSYTGQDRTKNTIELANGDPIELTKDAFLQATSICGIPKGYASRLPSNMLQDQLNYWLGKDKGLGDREFKLMALGAENPLGAAFVRPGVQAYSNVRLLLETAERIKAHYGIDADQLYADYKFAHDVGQTRVRLIVPEVARQIKSHRGDDPWSTGVSLTNSLTGALPTTVEGYLFAWWCTNGSIDTHSSSGAWSRKGAHTPEDVYEWARNSVDAVLGGLESSLDEVEGLTQVSVEGDTAAVLRDVFETFKVPVPIRSQIIENMVAVSELNMYEMQAAVTAAANAADVDPGQVEALLRAGGRLIYEADHRCDGCHRILPS